MDYLQDNKMSVNKEIKHAETDYSQKPKTNVKNKKQKTNKTKTDRLFTKQNKSKQIKHTKLDIYQTIRYILDYS